MDFVGKSNLAACFAAIALASVSIVVCADEQAPQGEPYHLSESEFRDLRDYMDRAQATLIQTLKSASFRGGVERHDVLIRGLRDALKEGDQGQDLLLFRSELQRAEELDELFIGSGDPRMVLVASSSVLVPSIEKALAYYRDDDNPRVSSVNAFLPDWATFARDQIPIWLRTADFAPRAAHPQIVLRALGWSAQALNRSAVARRQFARQIVALADTQSALEEGRTDLPHAQQLLLQVDKALGGSLTSAGGAAAVPACDFPGIDFAQVPEEKKENTEFEPSP